MLNASRVGLVFQVKACQDKECDGIDCLWGESWPQGLEYRNRIGIQTDLRYLRRGFKCTSLQTPSELPHIRGAMPLGGARLQSRMSTVPISHLLCLCGFLQAKKAHHMQ